MITRFDQGLIFFLVLRLIEKKPILLESVIRMLFEEAKQNRVVVLVGLCVSLLYTTGGHRGRSSDYSPKSVKDSRKCLNNYN